MKRKSLAITVVTLATVFSLAAMELILAYPLYYLLRGESFYSLASRNVAFLFEEDDFVGYRLAPNINRKIPPAYDTKKAPRRAVFYDFQTNAQGFRYHENLSPERRRDEIRIFCLGGSTTQGGESPNAFTYPQLLEQALRREIKEVRVINAGVGGYRSIHLKRYYEKVIRNYRPDIITIYEGWNDFEDSMLGYWVPGNPHGHALSTQFFLHGRQGGYWQRALGKLALFNTGARAYFALTNKDRIEPAADATRAFVRSAMDNRWIEEYYSNISALVKLAIADGVTPVLINPASPVFQGAADEIKRFANEDLNMGGRWDGFIVVKTRIHETNARIAKENGIPLIELDRTFDKYNQNYKHKFSFFTDRFHLTNEGNRVIAEALAPQLTGIIRDRLTVRSSGDSDIRKEDAKSRFQEKHGRADAAREGGVVRTHG